MVVKAIVPERDPEKYRTIIGVDSSSLGLAWTVLIDGKMVAQGKLKLDKIRTMQDKLQALYDFWYDFLLETKPDHVFIEKSIFVSNPATARTLSYIVGAVMAITVGEGYECTDVEPSTWKSFLGYKNLSGKFVASTKEILGKDSKKFCDQLRKSQTWRVIRHNYPEQAEGSAAETDHDIADSWGIALYGYNLIAQELTLEKTKEVTLDLAELDRLGLAL